MQSLIQHLLLEDGHLLECAEITIFSIHSKISLFQSSVCQIPQHIYTKALISDTFFPVKYQSQ